MATHERELTEPVDLCTPDGRRLDPAARGWSRRVLHRANLAGRWGRTKRWDYWAVLGEDVVVSVVYADVDYLGIAAVEWIDLATGRAGGCNRAVPLARGLELPEVAGSAPSHFGDRRLRLSLVPRPDGTHLWARWTEADGTPGALDVVVAEPPDLESLNVVVPWSETRFQFTSKHQARPVAGTLTVGERVVRFGDDGQEAWGVLDVGRGRWPYRTRWNWGGGAGRARAAGGGEGPVVGIQIGAKWTEGTGATENGILVDGRLEKIGEELDWDYSWDEPLRPWRVRSAAGDLDLTLAPRHDRHARTEALVLRTEVHQVFGRWTGTVPDGAGGRLEVDGLVGFAEESRSRW
jgi:hypothetical protein